MRNRREINREPGSAADGHRRARGERGAVMIELLFAVPLLVLCTLAIVQGLVLSSGLGALGVAAKDAARVAADSCSTGSPRTAAARAVPDFVEIRQVNVTRSGDSYHSQVVAALRFQVADFAIGEFEVAKEAEMPRLSACR